MSNGMNVFNVMEGLTKSLDQVKGVVERKLEPSLIKKRKQGPVELSYIGGHTVIRLLNEAFGYQWSFEIVSEEVIASQPKVNKYKPSEAPELQPPVAKVLGRLTVPGYGVKEQYGSKILIGGATEQESVWKSASTDAMKKCATLFGIGLELYDDEEDDKAETATTQPATTVKAPPARPNTYNQSPTVPTAATKFDPADIVKIKELKDGLGVTENAQLDPYAREFLDNEKATFKNITPSNIKAFNIFLSKKVQLA